MQPLLDTRAHARHRWANRFARVFTWVSMPFLALLVLLGPLWLVVTAVLVAFALLGHSRTRRNRWVIEQPGAGSRFRFGVDARASVTRDALDGIILARYPGASTRGLQLTKPHEEWHLVSKGGERLASAITIGLDPVDVERARELLGVPELPIAEARRRDLLPTGMPWTARHPVAFALALLGATAAVIVVLAVTTEPLHWSTLLAG